MPRVAGRRELKFEPPNERLRCPKCGVLCGTSDTLQVHHYFCNDEVKQKRSVDLNRDAESILSEIFTIVRRMPHGNPGFNFLCDGKKVSVRSSRVNGNHWAFFIAHNVVPDCFALFAFDDNDELIHVWLIPGEIISDRTRLIITDLERWREWEVRS